jgi:hypothetical protein
MASAIGAILMAGSTFAFADDWEARQVVTSSRYVHHDGGHDSDHAQCSYRGHVHSHVRPYVAYHHHHHRYWRPYHHPHSGLTIIYRGSFH